MDCIHARLLIVLHHRDAHELDAAAVAGLDQHLEQCADCLAWSHQESRVDEALAHAVQAVPVPAQLPSRLLHQLEHQPRPRRLLRWASAAAACLLIGLGLAVYFWSAQPVELTFDVVEDKYSVALKSVEAVEASFADEGMTIVAPREVNNGSLNYDLYQWSGFVKLKGRNVPRIDFFHPGDAETPAAVAHAYVVSQEQFDVQELLDSVPSPTPSNNHIVEVLAANESGFVYIFVYTGSSLRPFLHRVPGI